MKVAWPALIVVSLGCLSASEADAQGLPLVIQPAVPQPSREVEPPQQVRSEEHTSELQSR